MREGFSSLHFLSFLSKFSPFSGFERRFLLSGRGFELSLYSCGFEGFKALYDSAFMSQNTSLSFATRLESSVPGFCRVQKERPSETGRDAQFLRYSIQICGKQERLSCHFRHYPPRYSPRRAGPSSLYGVIHLSAVAVDYSEHREHKHNGQCDIKHHVRTKQQHQRDKRDTDGYGI